MEHWPSHITLPYLKSRSERTRRENTLRCRGVEQNFCFWVTITIFMCSNSCFRRTHRLCELFVVAPPRPLSLIECHVHTRCCCSTRAG